MNRTVLLALGLAACSSSDKEYRVHFDPLVGGQPFSCTQTYGNVGTSQASVGIVDFHMYVSAVSFVRAGGERVPLELVPDGQWQNDQGLAYLDFEDGTGSCDTGSPKTNFDIVGKAPEHGDYDGIEFTVGVPEAQDHLDVVSAAPPLNDPDMFWSWQGGYRYLKIDVMPAGSPEYFFHLGAEQCSGKDSTGYSCTWNNVAPIALTGFTPGTSEVALDLATLFSTTDLLAVQPASDPVPGCMSSAQDPECPPLFAKLGMGFENAPSPGPQSFFSVQAAH